jgi:hypothetical protein
MREKTKICPNHATVQLAIDNIHKYLNAISTPRNTKKKKTSAPTSIDENQLQLPYVEKWYCSPYTNDAVAKELSHVYNWHVEAVAHDITVLAYWIYI